MVHGGSSSVTESQQPRRQLNLLRSSSMAAPNVSGSNLATYGRRKSLPVTGKGGSAAAAVDVLEESLIRARRSSFSGVAGPPFLEEGSRVRHAQGQPTQRRDVWIGPISSSAMAVDVANDALDTHVQYQQIQSSYPLVPQRQPPSAAPAPGNSHWSRTRTMH